MTAGQQVDYAVDIVLCIDQTGSMAPIIESVKHHALSFSDELRSALEKKDRYVDVLRVRVIGFRDYYYDGQEAMDASEFFTLPDESTKFEAFVSGLTPKGGGDEPESGLEALALAIKSPWTTAGTKKRQVIVVWTDASAHPLEKSSSTPIEAYPGGMPKDLDELTDWWEDPQSGSVDPRAKRLIIYAPDSAGWSEIASSWEETVHFPSTAGEGLRDIEYQEILSSIVESIK
ncbi:VWA domain-containing protein [Mycobacterium barrassiae]|uniref:vWA domain-containing protein n=1 Tax=Mycobacterium barrassiae TaxID=319709 RepID=UPI0022658BFF|nr:vWA domain-containing protein [Mycobacterium barrassiae]MCV7303513.1 VWA domain-containing protein [Mycobacterium barrassiae]